MTLVHSQPLAPPRSALLLRPDTMGDLVLFAPALRRLQEGWPGTRVSVVIRRPYVGLGRLLAPGVDWVPTLIDPFTQGPAVSGPELTRLAGVVKEIAPDLVVAACFRRNWLDEIVAATVPGARRVAFGSNDEDPFFGVQVRHRLGAKLGGGFEELATAAAGDEDWRRNFGLVEYLLGRAVAPSEPSLTVGSDELARADKVLGGWGLKPGGFVACAAAGFANVRIKTWPAERFARTLCWLEKEKGLRALLVGHEGERDYLESLAAAAPSAKPGIWLGGEGELPTLGALLARSALFFGNDTGALHLAAAVGKPIVAVFGGGTWPRFRPAARLGSALVHPLPCFGCGWDCPFGDAPCVLAVPEEEVRKALSDVLKERPVVAPGQEQAPPATEEKLSAEAQRGVAFAGGSGAAPFASRSHEGCESREVRTLPEALVGFMGKAAALARKRAAGHLAREHKLEEIVFLAEEKDGEIRSLKATLDERQAELEIKEAEIAAKEAEINAKEAGIAAKEAEINAKEEEIGKKQAEIDSLARACEERLRLIERLDADLKRCVGEVGRLQTQLAFAKK